MKRLSDLLRVPQLTSCRARIQPRRCGHFDPLPPTAAFIVFISPTWCWIPGNTAPVLKEKTKEGEDGKGSTSPCMLSPFSRVRLCDRMDCSPPDSSVMGFSRQEHWSGLPCPPPGDLPDPGIEPTSFMSLDLAGRFLTTGATWEAPTQLWARAVSPGAQGP